MRILLQSSLILLLSVICLTTIQAQTRSDTLINAINFAPTDSHKVERILDLCFEYQYDYIDSMDIAYGYSMDAMLIAERINNHKQQISILNFQSIIQRDQGKYEIAIEKNIKATEIAKKNGLDRYVSLLEDNLSIIYTLTAEYDKALELKYKALDNILEKDDSTSTSIAYSGLGNIYYSKENYEKAKEYFLGSYDYRPTSPTSLGNLGLVYKHIGDLDSALYYYQLADLHLTKGSKSHIINIQAIAELYHAKENYTSAIEQFNTALQFFPDTITRDLGIMVASRLMSLLITQNEMEEAKKIAKRIQIENISTVSLKTKLNYFEAQSRYYANSKDYERAYSFSRNLFRTQLKLNDIEREEKFKLIETLYETKQKEQKINDQKIAIQKSKNEKRILGTILFFVLLGGVSLYYFLKKQAKTKLELQNKNLALKEKEIENLKIENKINSLQAILEGQEEERRRIAMDLHDNIGSMMAAIKVKMMNIQENIASLEKMNIGVQLDSMITDVSAEVRRISHNMTPIAFNLTGLEGAISDLTDELNNKGISVTNDLTDLSNIKEQSTSIMVFRTLQEILHNVEKHAKADHIRMESYQEGDELYIQIGDNGVGFDPIIWEENKGLGLKSIQSRIAYLNGSIKLELDGGTIYKIRIPI